MNSDVSGFLFCSRRLSEGYSSKGECPVKTDRVRNFFKGVFDVMRNRNVIVGSLINLVTIFAIALPSAINFSSHPLLSSYGIALFLILSTLIGWLLPYKVRE